MPLAPLNTTPSSSSPLPTTPLPTPSHSLSPTDILELLIPHTQTPDDPDSAATIASFLTPDALINNAHDPTTAIASLPVPQSPLTDFDPPTIEAHDEPEPTFRWSARFTYANDDKFDFSLTLTQTTTGPHAACWLISELNISKLDTDSS